MIKNFKSLETAKIYQLEFSRKLPGDIQQTALRKLKYLAAAVSIDDLRIPPGNMLEMLKGDRAGQWSIRINSQRRICFVWNEGAEQVEIVDYH